MDAFFRPAYIAGLIGRGDRKSAQPMAARTDEVIHQLPHHRSLPSAENAKFVLQQDRIRHA